MTDYCSVSEIKARTGKSQTDDDTVLTALVTAASRAIDSYCNRPDGFVALSVATARVYAGSGRSWMPIDECTEISLVAVKDSPTDTTYTSWAATDWVAFRGDPKRPNFNATPYSAIMCTAYGDYSAFLNGQYITRSGFRPDPDNDTYRGVPTVQVTAKWGYATTVPAAIKEAAVVLASRWYKRGQSAWSDVLANTETGMLMYRKEIDPDVKFMLSAGRYVRPAV
jgi:hypothetical protein